MSALICPACEKPLTGSFRFSLATRVADNCVIDLPIVCRDCVSLVMGAIVDNTISLSLANKDQIDELMKKPGGIEIFYEIKHLNERSNNGGEKKDSPRPT